MPAPTAKTTGNPAIMALVCAAVSAYLIYSIATATESPSRSLALLQYVRVGLALIGCIGSFAKYLSGK
jgi:hypothetical protein